MSSEKHYLNVIVQRFKDCNVTVKTPWDTADDGASGAPDSALAKDTSIEGSALVEESEPDKDATPTNKSAADNNEYSTNVYLERVKDITANESADPKNAQTVQSADPNDARTVESAVPSDASAATDANKEPPDSSKSATTSGSNECGTKSRVSKSGVAASSDLIYLKYWFLGDAFSCFLLSSGTIQVNSPYLQNLCEFVLKMWVFFT